MGTLILLPLANPLTAVAIFLGMSGGMTKEERHKTARQSAFYTLLILLTTWYLGNYIMKMFGISIPGLQISGGMIVAFIGFVMLFPSQKESADGIPVKKNMNISFVPLAMPATAGPGTIALIISSASTFHIDGKVSDLAFFIAPPVISLIIAGLLWGSLRCSSGIMRYLGESGIEAISRLMGFLLVCIGVQFLINGILAIVSHYPEV